MHSLLSVIVVVVIIVLALIAVIISQSLLNERLKKEIKSEEDSHARSRKEHSEFVVNSEAKSKSLSETMLYVMETNNDLNKCNDEIITLMEQHTPAMEGLIKDNENLLAAQERLVDCIRKTGIRDNKGVTRKATESQISEMLGKSVVWDSSKPFPVQYMIPKGTEVICVVENEWVGIGSKGITLHLNSNAPLCKWDEETNFIAGAENWYLPGHSLAPVNPTDHPEHPQFKK